MTQKEFYEVAICVADFIGELNDHMKSKWITLTEDDFERIYISLIVKFIGRFELEFDNFDTEMFKIMLCRYCSMLVHGKDIQDSIAAIDKTFYTIKQEE